LVPGEGLIFGIF